MVNKDLRTYTSNYGVRLWEIAERLNINDGNFSRRLRKELSCEEKDHIKKIIDDIASKKSEDVA